MRSMSGTEPSVKPINLNVLPVWKSGLTGRGVVVTILDDGESMSLLVTHIRGGLASLKVYSGVSGTCRQTMRISTANLYYSLLTLLPLLGVETNHTDLIHNYVCNLL